MSFLGSAFISITLWINLDFDSLVHGSSSDSNHNPSIIGDTDNGEERVCVVVARREKQNARLMQINYSDEMVSG